MLVWNGLRAHRTRYRSASCPIQVDHFRIPDDSSGTGLDAPMEGLAEMALARAQYQGPSPLPAVLLASRGRNPARRAARYDTLRADTSGQQHDEESNGGKTMKRMLVSVAATLMVAIGIANAVDPPELKEGLWSIHTQSIDNPGNKKSDGKYTLCRNHAFDQSGLADRKSTR